MLKRYIFFTGFLWLCFLKTNASIVVLNGLTHMHKIENGQVYKGIISIENTSSNPQNVKVYLQDYSYQASGVINYDKPLTNPKTSAGWMKLNTDLLTLKGKEKRDIAYEITIPSYLAQAGSYWNVIMVEPTDDLKPIPGKGVNITSIVRYAIQIIANYRTEDIKPDLTFEGVKIEKENKARTLKIAIANKGLVYCRPQATIEIYDQKSGNKVNTLSSLSMSLLPNTSKSFNIDISNIPPAKYTAVLIATDEDDNAFALNIDLDVKDD